jgi:hypothetical protein
MCYITEGDCQKDEGKTGMTTHVFQVGICYTKIDSSVKTPIWRMTAASDSWHIHSKLKPASKYFVEIIATFIDCERGGKFLLRRRQRMLVLGGLRYLRRGL